MISLIVAIVGIILGFFGGYWYFNNIYMRKLKEAKRTSEDIIERAKKEADLIKKNAELKAQEFIIQEKRNFEREIQNLKKELEKERRSLIEERKALEMRMEKLANKERDLSLRERRIQEQEDRLRKDEKRLEEMIEEETKTLERIAGMTTEQAREELLKKVERLAQYEAMQLAYKIREEAKEKAAKEAKEIIATAIQRFSASQVSETSITVVPLPNDEIKGRIIGREGRNIRAFEMATGVELIIDDTPEAVTLSCFDPIRREIAKIALERLIQDGRIHPGKIEEIVERVREEFGEYIKMIGEETLVKVGIPSMHPELVSLIGKMKFRTSYGQNLLSHSIEVAQISALMAYELGLESDLAKRAGLLHDVGKVLDENYEGSHAYVGAIIAKKYGENDVVANAIHAHHEEVEPISPIAILVAAADAISGARPGARRETIEAYIKRIAKLEEIATSFDGVVKAYALQAGRDLRIIVEANKVNDIEAAELAKNIAQRIEREMEYPGQIKVSVIREFRAISYAR